MQTIIRYGKQFIQYVRNNSAVSALEYALLIGIIAVAIATALATLGRNVGEAITDVGGKVKAAGDAVGNISPGSN